MGAILCSALGLLLALRGTGWIVFAGVWLCGVGANYIPLAVHARTLSRPGALDAALQEADPARELRLAARRQMWIAVPLALVVGEILRGREL